MKWLIIAVVVIAVLLLLAVVLRATQRKKQEVARERAGELRSEVATSSHDHQEQEALAREREAEAERARAQADRLQAQADRERTAVDQTQAHHEDRLREADRLDPDVDHRADDYSPTGTRDGVRDETRGGVHDGGHHDTHLGSSRTDGFDGPTEDRAGRSDGYAEGQTREEGLEAPRQHGDGTERI